MTDVMVSSILGGLVVTLQVIVLALLVAAPLSLIVALGRISRSRILRGIAAVYVEFLRGTSALVQLFWAFYVLPAFGVTAPPFAVGVIVLGLNASAYGAWAVRIDDTELREAFNAELKKLNESGELLKLQEPFGYDADSIPDPSVTSASLCPDATWAK